MGADAVAVAARRLQLYSGRRTVRRGEPPGPRDPGVGAPAVIVRRHPGPDFGRVLFGDHSAVSVHRDPAGGGRKDQWRPEAAGTAALSADRSRYREVCGSDGRLAGRADPGAVGFDRLGIPRRPSGYTGNRHFVAGHMLYALLIGAISFLAAALT